MMKLFKNSLFRFVLGFVVIMLLKIVLQKTDRYVAQTDMIYLQLLAMPVIYMIIGMLLPFMLNIERSYVGKSLMGWVLIFCFLLVMAYGPVIFTLIVKIPYVKDIFVKFCWPVYLRLSDGGFIQIISSLSIGILLFAKLEFVKRVKKG